MHTHEIQLFYEYNYWADRRILSACHKVSRAQFVAPPGPGTGWGSLRATLVHTLDSEWSWRRSFQKHFVPLDQQKGAGEPSLWDAQELTEADLPSLEALQERWQAEEGEMRAYLAGLSDEDLDGLVRYRIPEGIVRERVLWHCLLHVVNHGTQHRSEAAVLLTSYGQSPGGLDFTWFLNGYFNLRS